jgi:hypothetical protein
MPSRTNAEAQRVSPDEKSGGAVGFTLGRDEPASTGLELNPGDLVNEGDKEMQGALQLIMTRNEQILAHIL